MQNIQDLKEKIFFESKNIIDNLDKINNIDELLSKQDLVDELANRISFLKLLEKNIDYFISDNSLDISENQEKKSFMKNDSDFNEVTEEEAIFNNELNEIDENEEEAIIFSNQINDIVENEVHENLIHSIRESEESEYLKFDNSEFSSDRINEEVFLSDELSSVAIQETLETNESGNAEEIAGLNTDNKFNESYQPEINSINDFEEEGEMNIVDSEPEVKIAEISSSEVSERIPDIFDEETEDDFVASNISISQGEFASDTSNVENILREIKNEIPAEEKIQEIYISDIENDTKETDDIKIETESEDNSLSVSDFESIEEDHYERKIKLAHIKGLNVVQTLFDNPLEKDNSDKNQKSEVKEENAKPEFKLDLNDRIAFSKMLFGGSQSELNEVVSALNGFKRIEEAKEYLSDLYYEKKWNKVDEYAQRLWILVENKFL